MQLITSESIENLLNHDDVDTNRLKREKFNSDVCRGLRMLIDGIQRATPAGVLDVVAVSDTAQSVLRIATHLVCILLTEEVSSREFGTFLPSSHPRFALVKMCACAIEVVSQWRSLAGFTFYKDLRSSDDVRLINDSFSLALDGRNQPLFRQKLEKRSGDIRPPPEDEARTCSPCENS